MTENAGIISEANPSEMKYTDTYGNICTWYVDCPEALSKLIFSSDVINTQNQRCQDLLQLENPRLTKYSFFHLSTMLIGINVIDTFLLTNHHKVIHV
jgi:hypothetical protein